MAYENVFIQTDYITLGQFIKLAGIIDTGGQAKEYLTGANIAVNDVKENRRGRKLYPNDVVVIDGEHGFVVARH